MTTRTSPGLVLSLLVTVTVSLESEWSGREGRWRRGDWRAEEGDDWGGWQRLGHCRAYCFQRFIPLEPTEAKLRLNSQCKECWERCDLLFETDTANRFCRPHRANRTCPSEACDTFCQYVDHYQTQGVERRENLTCNPIVNVIDLTHLAIKWEPPLAGITGPVIYSLFYADRNSRVWTYLDMLLGQRAEVSDDLRAYPDLRFRLLAHTADAILSDDSFSAGLDYVNFDILTDGLDLHDNVPDVEDSHFAHPGESMANLELEINVTRNSGGYLFVTVALDRPGDAVTAHDQFVVNWARNTCNLDLRYPSCDALPQHWQMELLRPQVNDKKWTFKLPNLTYNSQYWVNVSGRSGKPSRSTRHFEFMTPPCECPDRTFTRCRDVTSGSCRQPSPDFLTAIDNPASLRNRYKDGEDTLQSYHTNTSCIHVEGSTVHVKLELSRAFPKGGSSVTYTVHVSSLEGHLEVKHETSPRIKLSLNADDFYIIKTIAGRRTALPGGDLDRISYPEVFINTSRAHLTKWACPEALSQPNRMPWFYHIIITLSALGFIAIVTIVLYVVYRKCNSFRGIMIPKATVAKSNTYKTSLGSYPHCLKEETLLMLPDEWELDARDVSLGRELGEGAFGRVMTGYYRDQKVAIKILKDDVEDYYRDDLRREVNLMKQIGKHPNIVSMIGACTLKEPLALVMEYMPYGNLQNFLRRCRLEGELQRTDDSCCELIYSQLNELGNLEEWSVSSTDVLSFARQVVLAMEYLSNRQYIHRDLAARNILLGPKKVVKVCDFGLARIVYNGDLYYKVSNGRLPMKWMALESLQDRKFTTFSDVWSFGVLLWEIVTMGASPYPGVALADLSRLLTDGYRMEQPPNCSAELYDVMCQCWYETATDRPTFTNLRQMLENLLTRDREYLDLSTFNLPTTSSQPESRSHSDDEDDKATIISSSQCISHERSPTMKSATWQSESNDDVIPDEGVNERRSEESLVLRVSPCSYSPLFSRTAPDYVDAKDRYAGGDVVVTMSSVL